MCTCETPEIHLASSVTSRQIHTLKPILIVLRLHFLGTLTSKIRKSDFLFGEMTTRPI